VRPHASAEARPPAFDLARLVFFSDGVFAIVITLLVLPLTEQVDVPPDDLAPQVWDEWPRLVSFVVSFLVVGQFWIVHHRMYATFVRCTTGLVWHNLASLLTVSFLPFPAALLGEHATAEDRFPVVFYAASLTLTSASFTATWLYALRHALVDGHADRDERMVLTVRSVITTSVFVVSIGAAFFGLVPTAICWLVLLPVARKIVVRRRRAGSAAT